MSTETWQDVPASDVEIGDTVEVGDLRGVVTNKSWDKGVPDFQIDTRSLLFMSSASELVRVLVTEERF